MLCALVRGREVEREGERREAYAQDTGLQL